MLFTYDLSEQTQCKGVFHASRIFSDTILHKSLKQLCLRPLPLHVCTDIAQPWPAFLKLV